MNMKLAWKWKAATENSMKVVMPLSPTYVNKKGAKQMKKWRNCELHNVNDAEAIRAIRVYCNMHHIPYETSDAGYNLTHFEIYCDDEMAKSFNAIISGKAVYHF